MVSVVSRTIIIYIVLLIAMRLMGKRQIGELQASELIITFLLSELAAAPITAKELPLLHAIIPIFLLLSLEVITSFLLTKCNLLKRLLYGSPTILIRDGKIDVDALARNRIEIDELMAELRQKNAPDIASVKYAVLEDNGKLSVFLKAEKSPPTASDLKAISVDCGIAHELIIDGEIMWKNLTLLGKDSAWLTEQLQCRHITQKEVFLLTLDDGGTVQLIRKEKRK